MSYEPLIKLPIFVVANDSGCEMFIVLSVSTFREEKGEKPETLLPVVEDALNFAQQLSGSDLLLSFYLHNAAGDVVVRRIRNIMKRCFEAERPVLWLRADSEQFLQAALSIIQVDYPTIRAIAPAPSKESAQ